MTNIDQTGQPEPGKKYVHKHIPRDYWRECPVCGSTFEHYHPEGWQKPKDLVMSLPESPTNDEGFVKPEIAKLINDNIDDLFEGQQPEDGELISALKDGAFLRVNGGATFIDYERLAKFVTAWADRRSQAVQQGEVEAAGRQYFESVLRSRAKTDPNITIQEWHDRHFEVGKYKPHYSAAQAKGEQNVR